MTAKVSKKNSFSTLSYQVLWLGSGIRPPRTIPLGPRFMLSFIIKNGDSVNNDVVDWQEANNYKMIDVPQSQGRYNNRNEVLIKNY